MRNYKLLSSLGLVFVMVISCGSNKKKKKDEGLVTDTENQMNQQDTTTVSDLGDTAIYHHSTDDSAMSRYKDSINAQKRKNLED